jgi:hypothetical protein
VGNQASAALALSDAPLGTWGEAVKLTRNAPVLMRNFAGVLVKSGNGSFTRYGLIAGCQYKPRKARQGGPEKAAKNGCCRSRFLASGTMRPGGLIRVVALQQDQYASYVAPESAPRSLPRRQTGSDTGKNPRVRRGDAVEQRRKQTVCCAKML